MPEERFRCQAVVFDLDGTLADSLNEIAGAMNEVLRAYGFSGHPVEAYRHMIGEGVETLVRRALPADAHARVPHLLTEYRQRYAQKMHLTAPYAGIENMLTVLEERHVHKAVLSNKRDDFTQAMVRTLFGRWQFFDIRGERQGMPRKPHPQAALEMVEALGVLPQHCAFVGDTAIDMQTAVNAGMVPVGVLWGFRGREELLAAGARCLISQPMELLEVLL